MIHIATLHYQDESWIDIQLKQLERHTSEDYRVYACLDGVSRKYFERFHYAVERNEPIVPELDHLAGVISEQADPDDVMVFVHGDTLPVAEWAGPIRAMLERRPMAAVRRDENLGEPHPHWVFTATTPRLWAELDTDWSRGPTWVGTNGLEVTDLGAHLWRELEDRGIEWTPILRSNTTNLHPLWFGVYGDMIYHHGAAFRKPLSRIDADAAPPKKHIFLPLRYLALERAARRSARISRRLHARIERGEDVWWELADAPESERAAA
ncbi:MAG: hypothetical protein ACR2N5_02370 [Solirubrobacterales bacterium]